MTDRRLRPVAVDGYRAELIAQAESVREKHAKLDSRYEQLVEAHAAKLGALAEPPMADDDATEVEYLRCRVAQEQVHLAYVERDVELGEAFLEQQTVQAELADLDYRIGHVDYLVEENLGLVAAGNDAQLAVMALEAQEEAFTRATAATELDFARRRLTLVKQVVSELQAALKKAERAEARSAARKAGQA